MRTGFAAALSLAALAALNAAARPISDIGTEPAGSCERPDLLLFNQQFRLSVRLPVPEAEFVGLLTRRGAEFVRAPSAAMVLPNFRFLSEAGRRRLSHGYVIGVPYNRTEGASAIFVAAVDREGMVFHLERQVGYATPI